MLFMQVIFTGFLGMIEKFKQLKSSEKVMIGMIIILSIMVLLNWKNVQKGLNKGYHPVKTEEIRKN